MVKVKCYTDNKSIVISLTSSKKLDNPMLNIDTLILREYLERGTIACVE